MVQNSYGRAGRTLLAMASTVALLTASTAWAESSSRSRYSGDDDFSSRSSSSQYVSSSRKSPFASSARPTTQQIEQLINRKTGVNFRYHEWRWNTPQGRSRRSTARLSGTGTIGQDLRVKIDCNVSYPPLRIECTITFSL